MPRFLGGLLLLASQSAIADILWMNNGDRLTGTIEEITDVQVCITLPYSQMLTVKRGAIKRWRLDKQPLSRPLVKTGIHLQNSADSAYACGLAAAVSTSS